MIFSVTEIQTYLRCRRRAVLTSKNGKHLTPIFSPLSLNVGSIVHRAHQLWLNDPAQDLNMHALTASLEANEAVKANYTKAVGTTPSDLEMLSLHEAIEMSLSMCQNYYIRYGTPLPPEYTLVSAEQKIRVPIPTTEHFLQGRLDGLIRHQSGRLDVLERKTYASRPKIEDLQFSFQFVGYVWLVTQLRLSPTTPMIAYDGLWRRALVPRGRQFNDLFSRHILTRSQHEIEEFGRFLPAIANEMASVYTDHTLAYPHRPWTGCWDCNVTTICDAMSRGEEYEAITRSQFAIRTDDVDDEIESEV